MSDKSEDGECSSSPKSKEVLEMLDNGGCFVLDRNDDAFEEDVIVLNTSDMQPKEEVDEEEEDHQSTKKNNWLKSTMASVMSLNEDEAKVEETKRKDNRRKPQCFNCLGEHNMVSCPEPKNLRRIRENRDAFNDARSKEPRYSEPQTGHTGEFKPGRLSDNLQRALGIGPNDIPEFIYRMRKLGLKKGYPPGYLKNAIVKQTNPDDLLTFHSDNPELKGDAEETNERPLSPTVNPDKVIYYFGFNQTYRALRDRELRFSVPPFNEFVGILNEYVKKEFWEEKKREERKRKTSTIVERENYEKRAKQEVEDDDCMILEAPPPPPIIDINEEDDEREETSLDESSVVVSPNGTPLSRRVSIGTPVLQRKNLGDGMKKVPSLDAFAVGIVPFQVDEPTPRTGFLQKMLKKIKDKLG